MTSLECTIIPCPAGTMSKPLNQERPSDLQKVTQQVGGAAAILPDSPVLALDLHSVREGTSYRATCIAGLTAPLSRPVHSLFKPRLQLLTLGPYFGLSVDNSAGGTGEEKKEGSRDHCVLSSLSPFHKQLTPLWLVFKGLVFYQFENTDPHPHPYA